MKGRTVIPTVLRPTELSSQEGVYYKGCVPGSDTKNLWAYSHRTEPKKEAPRYMFVDCSLDDDDPLLVGFTASEVSAYLERV